MAQRAWWTDWNLSYLDDVYGPLYGGHSVQEAVYNTLQEWLPSYVAEFNRNLGSNVLKEPFEYRHRPDYRTLPRDASAAVLITVPGTIGLPETLQESTRVNWRVEAMIFVYGTKDWQETEALTQAYTACVRACIIQHRDLGGFAETTLWDGEEYMEGEHSGTRTTGVGHVRFAVTVGNAMKMNGGVPLPQFAATGAVDYPTTFPPSPAPTVTSTRITVGEQRGI